MKFRRFFSLILLSALVLPALASADDAAIPEGFTRVGEAEGIVEYRYEPNGLTVLLLEDHSSPVATFMVTYLVGSRDEKAGTTGATHLLEHMMFKGTTNHNKERGNDYDGILENIGARLNATTSKDRTNYYANVPSEHLETVIRLEADRMRNLRLRAEDHELEMPVVRNEYEQGQNNPVMSLLHEIAATAYVAHPYQHPIIGYKSDIESMTVEDLRHFYDTYYWPDNATVSVIGDFQAPAALASIKEHYGEIPRSPEAIPEVHTVEPEQRGPRRTELHRPGQIGWIGMAHKGPEATHEDAAAVEVMNYILASGKNSRMYKSMVDKQIAANTYAFMWSRRDPGLIYTFAMMTPDGSHEATETAMLAEIERLQREPVPEAELERAKAQIYADTMYGRDGNFAIAIALNEAIAVGDWRLYYTFPKAVQEVTAADVRRVAQTYLQPTRRTTGWFVPQRPEATGGDPVAQLSLEMFGPALFYQAADHAGVLPGTLFGIASSVDASPAREALAPGSTMGFASRANQREINGIEVTTVPTGVRDVVTFMGSFAAGDIFSPDANPTVAAVTAELLDDGTLRHDKFALAAKLEAVGAELSFGTGAFTMTFEGRCLAKDLPMVLDVLAEQLREPVFPVEELEKAKVRLASGLRQQLDDVDTRADIALRSTLFPADHPNHAIDLETQLEALAALTREDLVAFHQDYYGPTSMRLVLVGDIDDAAIDSAVDEAFAGWSGGVDYPSVETVTSPGNGTIKEVEIADRNNINVRWGLAPGIDRTHPDYEALMVGTAILGQGFTGRLLNQVRDQQGLTYSIYAAIARSSLSDGLWWVAGNFDSHLLDQGIAATEEVVTTWYEEGVTEEELAQRKTRLVGNFKVDLTTTGDIAGSIHSVLLRGDSLAALDNYPARVQALTRDEVNSAIQRYIDLDAMVRVKAGSLPDDEAHDDAPETAEGE